MSEFFLQFAAPFAIMGNAETMKRKGGLKVKKYVCIICGWTYNEKEGDPDNGIEPGTRFEDLPDTFVCPECGVPKDEFEEDTLEED